MSTPPVVRFRANGIPVPQGSMSAFINKRTGRAQVTDQKGPKLKAWRKSVKQAAQLSVFADLAWKPIDGPVRVALLFGLPRPASYPKARRVWPVVRGHDLDKLTRAVWDACTDAGIWTDDALVVESHQAKDYCGYGQARLLTVPGVVVRVWRLETPPTTGQIPLLTEGNPA